MFLLDSILLSPCRQSSYSLVQDHNRRSFGELVVSFICSIHDWGHLLNLYDTAYLYLFFDSFVSLTIRLFTVAFPAQQTWGAAQLSPPGQPQ